VTIALAMISMRINAPAEVSGHRQDMEEHDTDVRPMKALSDCCVCNHSLDVGSTMLLVRQNVGSCCT
jgi:hypothetical protein